MWFLLLLLYGESCQRFLSPILKNVSIFKILGYMFSYLSENISIWEILQTLETCVPLLNYRLKIFPVFTWMCGQISPVLMRDRTNCGLLWTIRCAFAHYPQQFQALAEKKAKRSFCTYQTKSTGRTILIFLLNCSFSLLTSTSTTMLSKDKSGASSRTDLMFLKIYA